MKHAIVTGAAGGLGRTISDQLAEEGWAVGLLDLSQATIEKAGPLRKNCKAISCDVSDPMSVTKALEQFGQTPDLVVNNAGIVRFGPLIDLSQEDFDTVIRVNLVGAFIVAQQCAVAMRKAQTNGVIINITSMNGVVPGPNSGAYTSAKAGLAMLTKQMAVEWGPFGIRVNAIAPGLMDAGMSNAIHADPEIRKSREAKIPARRLGRADDISNLVSFLASDKASYITGENILVDGGITMSVLTMLPRPKTVDKVGAGE